MTFRDLLSTTTTTKRRWQAAFSDFIEVTDSDSDTQQSHAVSTIWKDLMDEIMYWWIQASPLARMRGTCIASQQHPLHCQLYLDFSFTEVFPQGHVICDMANTPC
ncbi:hypothetical protein K470DRAFT_172748 [Piedraia hortae CBS 480.64]|uniref:Uncharacterized protein n=1 Tax=Piedraia hortae CBS 480.64 TaxID=1314780 RepID=A0A6A7BQB3_9PEZI|nr:hypothetical protein K470DRAFT_172748 [Piedraia hortae CBS 480.64]